jgi:acetate kinase
VADASADVCGGPRLTVRILVVNAGSSSLKLSIVEDGCGLDAHDLPAPGAAVDPDQIARVVGTLAPVDAVGHRIVHGGTRYLGAVRIDASVIAGLWELADLAPLHQAKSLVALEAISGVLPGCPAFACFDTAFHATMDPGASTFALPAAWRRQWGLRRFGFHGLSHAYASRRAAELLDRPPDGLRVVTCHLGAGASLAAVHSGRSVDTTMGFTPLDGLPMATRSGSVDPGLLLWLLQRTQLTEAGMNHALEHESGMLALAGTAEMQTVLQRAGPGDEDATLGLAVYLHRLRGGIAAMAAAMNGLDVVVWTGGVGEHAPAVRAGATEGLGFLGLAIDRARNEMGTGDRNLSTEGAAVVSLVVTAREDLEIDRQVRSLLAATTPA